MVSAEDAAVRRANYAKNFRDAKFKAANSIQDDLDAFCENFLPPGFSARLPRSSEHLNAFSDCSMIFPLRHFEVGLRLPLWPEFCQILRHFGIVPAQINTNGIAIVMGFLCLLRAERIAFDLSVFCRIFPINATKEGVIFFSSHFCTVAGTLNKVHRWAEKLVVVTGDFGEIPRRPLQPSESAFVPPELNEAGEQLFQAFRQRRFDVVYWRREVDTLLEVLADEG